jgi:hypothetical protein
MEDTLAGEDELELSLFLEQLERLRGAQPLVRPRLGAGREVVPVSGGHHDGKVLPEVRLLKVEHVRIQQDQPAGIRLELDDLVHALSSSSGTARSRRSESLSRRAAAVGALTRQR